MPEMLQRDTFAEHLNGTFELFYGEQKVFDLKLTEVTPSKIQPAGEKKLETFSLIYDGPAQPILNQSLYTLKHEKMGAFEQFLVPIGIKDGAVQYQAVYNRFV